MRGTGNRYGNKRDRDEFAAKTTPRGAMKHQRRGQRVKLKNKETGKEVTAVVILVDTNMGYLAADEKEISPLVAHFIDEREWNWYHPDQWDEL